MSAPARPLGRLEGKIQPWHRDRLAVVYVRQSTAAQVQDHSESTRLQYGLAGRAAALGWAAPRVLVIDDDLGHSASGADARPGFQRLVSEVVLDPDEQVQAVIRLIFDLFGRLGTVNAVLCFLADNHIQLGVRVREGPARGELEWRRPSRATLQNILRNPAYAGIYAYGRSTTDPRRRQAGRPFTGRVRTAREDWAVFLPGLLPGYITIGQYEKNRQRMEANRSWSQGMGVVRNGPALLAGLVSCGRCGQKMTVRY